jgi:hypothetical protein
MTLFTDDSTSLDDMIFPVFRAKAPGHLILLGFGVGVSNVILHTLHAPDLLSCPFSCPHVSSLGSRQL